VPTLLELQNAVGRAIVAREDDEAAAHIIADRLAPSARLNIYRNTFIGSLATALRLAYPAIHRLVGVEFFEGAAQIFAGDHPPRSAYLDEYGAEFPDFLAHFRPAASLAYLSDVARLDWAANRALHAPDTKALEVTRLTAVNAVDQGRIRFTPHPAVSLIRADSPVDSIWRAVLEQDDPALAAIDLAGGPVWLIVQRQGAEVEVQRMSEAAWRFTAELYAGQPLQAALEMELEIDAPALLAGHFTAGRFIDFTLASPDHAIPTGELSMSTTT
jgi:hypothetical protein